MDPFAVAGCVLLCPCYARSAGMPAQPSKRALQCRQVFPPTFCTCRYQNDGIHARAVDRAAGGAGGVGGVWRAADGGDCPDQAAAAAAAQRAPPAGAVHVRVCALVAGAAPGGHCQPAICGPAARHASARLVVPHAGARELRPAVLCDLLCCWPCALYPSQHTTPSTCKEATLSSRPCCAHMASVHDIP